MKKRGLIFVFVLLSFVSFSVFLSTNVNAVNTCTGTGANAINQEIMSISGTSNAFGEAWDENTYNEQICYNTIIGAEYFPTSLGFRSCQYEQVLIDGLENYEISNYFITLDNSGKAYVAPALTGRPPADVNDDWEINALDIQLVFNCALGLCSSPTDGDINSDGVTNAVDIQLIINCALGLSNPSCNPPAPQPYPNIVKTSGNSDLDVNKDDKDNKLNFKDVQTVISCAINDVKLNNKFSCGFIDTDINNDGRTDVEDINLISERILLAGGWQNICYGTLDCKTVPQGVACSTLGTNYKNAVYLSTSALDGTGGKFSTSLTLGYPATICCSQPGETSGEPETSCVDRIDNNNNQLFDYADSTFCLESLCINQDKVVISPVGGTGAGAPWDTPNIYGDGDIANSGGEFAGCCSANSCYSGHPDVGGCKVNGDTINVGGSIQSITCSVLGTNAVWCKAGYENDGTGECIVENPSCPDNSCEQLVCPGGENCACTININTGDNCNAGLVCDPANLICKTFYPVCSTGGIWKQDGTNLNLLQCNYGGGSCCPLTNANGQSLSCNLHTGNCEIQTCVDNSDCSGDLFCNAQNVCQQNVPRCVNGEWKESDGTTPAPELACDYLGSANSCCPSGTTCGTDGICRDSGTTLPGGPNLDENTCASLIEGVAEANKKTACHPTINYYSDALLESIENLNVAFAEANGLDYNFCTNVDANDADCGCKYNTASGSCNEVVTLSSPLTGECITTEVKLDDTTSVCSVDNTEYYLRWKSSGSAIGCVNGARVFQCPSKVNLPFFTIFNLMISLMTILGIYFLMRIEKR